VDGSPGKVAAIARPDAVLKPTGTKKNNPDTGIGKFQLKPGMKKILNPRSFKKNGIKYLNQNALY
jgi:hypothetical protein